MPRRIANAAQAITQQVSRWQCDALVVFEATGIYDLALREALRQAGIQFARINPARARDFARASGLLAKTDPIDARMLAAFARAMQPAPSRSPILHGAPWRGLQNGGISWSSCAPRRRTGAARPTIAPWPNASAASSRSSTARSPRSRPTSAH
ncbi:IS110 family transposase [Bradyrhizobium elkanii]|uniref:IS110 family transposase n=1 Tax=Bradyrhizobium elkanii TaxID=29448 RepID=UPI002FF02D1B